MSVIFDLGDHAAFIWAAYGLAALVLAGLIGWVQYDARQQTRLLSELEARGVRRRSATPDGKKRT